MLLDVIRIPVIILALLTVSEISAEVVWTDYTSSNIINDIAIEGDYIWCATKGGVVRRDMRDGTYVKYTTADGLTGMHVCSVAVDADNVKWFGTNGQGISRFDGETWTTYYSEYGEAGNIINDITVDCDNVKWFGTWHGLMRFDGETWKTYTEKDGLYSHNIYSVAVDCDNVLWVGSYGFTVSFDGTAWTIYSKEYGFPSNTVYKITVDPVSGKKWFVGYYYVFSYDGNSIEIFERTKQKTIAVDYQGTIWIGSNGIGVSHYNGEMWIEYMMDHEALRQVNTALVTPDDIKWFGTSGGLLRYNGDEWTKYITEDAHSGELPYDQEIHMIAVDSDNVKWVLASGGVYTYNGVTWTKLTEKTNMPQWDIDCIAFGADNVKWFGSGDGLIKFDGTHWTTIKYGLVNNSISSLAVDQDNVLWVGYDSTERVISSFDGTRWRTHSLGAYDEVRVWSIMIDNNNVKWVVGTARGVNTECYSSVDGVAWKRDIVSGVMAFGKDNVIWCNNESTSLISYDGSVIKKYDKEYMFSVTSIVVDKRNIVWMGSSKGKVVRFDGYSWKYYGSSDGLIGDKINSIAVDDNNIKWIGTNNSVVSLDDSSIPVTIISTPRPLRFTLDTPYPNPFNLSVTIPFSLPEAALVEVSIYSITGQRVRSLTADRMPAGTHTLQWDGRDENGGEVSSGLYFVRFAGGGQVATRKLILVK